MALTTAQLATLKGAVDATPAWAVYPLTGDGFYDLAQTLNSLASPQFWVWSTDADAGAIRAAIVWANLTPTDAPDGTQSWANRSLQCQGKQFSLQIMLSGATSINGADTNLRAGLQDALQGVRSGVGGAAQDAGWSAVRNALARRATYVERLLADTAAGNGASRAASATLTFEGEVSAEDVSLARGL